MKIVLGSMNVSKQRSILIAMNELGFDDISIVPVNVNSLVSSKPINDETLIGAKNRNHGLYNYCMENDISFDLLISIEGGYEQIDNTYFIVTYASILDQNGNEFIGKSSGLQITERMFNYVKDGKSLNTTMGLTPLGGLMMGTRSGDIDAGVIPYLMDRKGMDTHQIIDYLNKKSGILGVSGISSDLREIISAANDGDERAKVTIDMMCNRVKKYICSYSGLLGGADAIVFTAGIGENSALIREKVCFNLDFMGIELDSEKNEIKTHEPREISKNSSKTKIFVIPTNEELVIAKDTYNLVK